MRDGARSLYVKVFDVGDVLNPRVVDYNVDAAPAQSRLRNTAVTSSKCEITQEVSYTEYSGVKTLRC
jgi:hypothetical protein